MPVAVQEKGAGGFEESVHFGDALLQPGDVVVYAARPAVLEGTDFTLITPDDLIIPVGKERRV